MRVLLVEDEEELAHRIQEGLEAVHYTVEWTPRGREALAWTRERSYAAVILDLMLPDLNGWRFCQALRARRDSTPILILTARGEIGDRVRGLELGADDYLVKPFEFAELRARVRALVRRASVHKARVFRLGALEVDTEGRTARVGGEPLELTPREYALLVALATNEGRVLSRSFIQEQVWLDDESYSNTVTVHVRQLRNKLDAAGLGRLIHTVYGQGYVLRCTEADGVPAPATGEGARNG